MDDKVRIQRALITAVVLITLGSPAYSWKCDTAEAGAHRKVLYMAAISALYVEAGSLGGECAGADDDAGYANEVGHICCGKATNGGLGD